MKKSEDLLKLINDTFVPMLVGQLNQKLSAAGVEWKANNVLKKRWLKIIDAASGILKHVATSLHQLTNAEAEDTAQQIEYICNNWYLSIWPEERVYEANESVNLWLSKTELIANLADRIDELDDNKININENNANDNINNNNDNINDNNNNNNNNI